MAKYDILLLESANDKNDKESLANDIIADFTNK